MNIIFKKYDYKIINIYKLYIMVEYIFVEFIGDYDPANPNMASASPEVVELIKKQIENMKSFSRFISFTTIRTIVTCPVTGNLYYVSFSMS